jgi:phosphoadenosine phosphosulfate reductase
LVDMSKQDLKLYTQLFELPLHPLLSQGYDSVGCTHCTRKGKGRSGRWVDLDKNECGLHDTDQLIRNRMAS